MESPEQREGGFQPGHEQGGREALTRNASERNQFGQSGPSTPKTYTKFGGGAGFRPSHFEKEYVSNLFNATHASATIGGYLKAIANYMSASPFVNEAGTVVPYDGERYRNAWHASAPDMIAAEVDKAIKDHDVDPGTLRKAVSLPLIAAVRTELSLYADPDKLDKLSKSYGIMEYRGMNRVTPYGSDISPEPAALTLMKGKTVVNLYGFERGQGKNKEFVGLAAKGDMVGLVKEVDFHPVPKLQRLPSGETVQTITVERLLREGGYLSDPDLSHPDGIYPNTSQDDILVLIQDMAKLGYRPRYTTPDDRAIYPDAIKGDRVESLASRAVLQVSKAVAAGAVDVAVEAFMKSDEGILDRLADSAHRECGRQFLRILKVAEEVGIDPEEAKECLVFAAHPMRALADYHKLYWDLIREGKHADPIYYIKEVLVDVLDLDRACDPKTRSSGMVTQSHIDQIGKILGTRTVQQLIPDYKDPLAALGLDDKIPQAKRLDMVMAILCTISEYVNGLVESRAVDPTHNIYQMVNDKDGNKVRIPIAKDRTKDPELPDNQVTWPSTKVRRFLTHVDPILKEVLDQSLQPLTKSYNTLRESTNRAMLELTLKRVLRADMRSSANPQTPERVTEIRDMVRAHLFGFRPLTAPEREFLDAALKSPDPVGTWLDELRSVMVNGPMLAAYRERITPEYQQREAFQYARDLEARFGSESKGMRHISMFPVSTYSAPINPTNIFIGVRDDDDTFTVYKIARPATEDGEILPPTLVPVEGMEAISHEDFVRFRIEENVNNAYIAIVQTTGNSRIEVDDAGMPIDPNKSKGGAPKIMGHTEAIMRRLGAPIVKDFEDPISGESVKAAIFSVKVLNSGITGMAPSTYRFLFNKGGDPARTGRDVAMVPTRMEQLCLDEQEFVKRNPYAKQGLVKAISANQDYINGPDGAPMSPEDIERLAQSIMSRKGKYSYDGFEAGIDRFAEDRVKSIRAMAAFETASARTRAAKRLEGAPSAATRANVEEALQVDLARISRVAEQRESGTREFCRFARVFNEKYKGYVGPWYGAVPDGSGLAKADIRFRFSDVRDIAPRIYDLQCGCNAVCRAEFIAIEEE
jgi:hypothetical protein